MFAAMQEVFVPDLAGGYRWLSFSAAVGMAAAAWAVAAYRGGVGGGGLRKVGQTLGPLLALCGLVGAVAVFVDMSRSPVIVVTPGYLLLGNDTVPVAKVRRAYLEPVAVGGGYGANAETEELGVIEFADGGSLLLSEGEYDTRAVVEAMDRVMGR